MVYDVIILGATFAAVGMASVWGDRCLILEQKPLVGYEFLNALNFGEAYDEALASEKARNLKERFCDCGAFNGERVCLFDCAGPLYQLLEDKNVYLNMTLVSVEEYDGQYEVIAHGTSGYRTFYAKRVVDTRVMQNMVQSKSLHILATGEEGGFASLCGYDVRPWGHAGESVVCVPVSADADYIGAREQVKKLLENEGKTLRLVCLADYFTFKLLPGSQKEKDGIYYLPSAGYANPLAAFDAGAEFAGGGEK